jgi:hypothetical protein
MSIFQTELTLRWALLAKSLQDGGMASSSIRSALGKATSLPGAPIGPICSPFRRLEGAVSGS